MKCMFQSKTFPLTYAQYTHTHTHTHTHTQVYAGYDGGSSYQVPTKEDLSKVKGREFSK
jgi:hypothetical protein